MYLYGITDHPSHRTQLRRTRERPYLEFTPRGKPGALRLHLRIPSTLVHHHIEGDPLDVLRSCERLLAGLGAVTHWAEQSSKRCNEHQPLLSAVALPKHTRLALAQVCRELNFSFDPGPYPGYALIVQAPADSARGLMLTLYTPEGAHSGLSTEATLDAATLLAPIFTGRAALPPHPGPHAWTRAGLQEHP